MSEETHLFGVCQEAEERQDRLNFGVCVGS